ncbi:dTDP-glucose 4,6-dehydratase [bioreactor metagenome]|uniref:dTDP-glucose 4,6-dehydratase n=1 Tax=bioreactor metagenome TaxID=1076179 RepID=A0A644TPL8_9ZZZZ
MKQFKKILVTGADGFIGSHLTEELIRQGANVKAFVQYNSFNSWGWLDESEKEIKEQLEVFAGDIRDPYGVRKAMQDCDCVLNLAALIAIPYSYHSPDTYVDTNVKGALNVVQAAKELGVQKVVQTSTSEVYGTAKFVPITEDHPLQGQSPYSASKIGADQIAMSFYNAFSTPVAIIRPFNTYGPRQSARAVIPTIITQIANGKRKIKLGSLFPTRDFNYVKDTVRGFFAITKSDKSVGEVINIGSNYEISIGDTVKLIAEVMNVDIEIETDEVRLRPEKSEVDRLWADNSKAKAVVGWEPTYGEYEGFKRGIQETIEWFINQENLKKYKADVYNI